MLPKSRCPRPFLRQRRVPRVLMETWRLVAVHHVSAVHGWHFLGYVGQGENVPSWETTVRSRRNSGNRYCISWKLCMEDGWGTCCICCCDAVLLIIVDRVLFGARRHVCSRQGYSQLRVEYKRIGRASGNKGIVRALVQAKRLGSGTADSRVREDGGSEEVGGLEWEA